MEIQYSNELQKIVTDKISGSKELQEKLNSYFYLNYSTLPDLLNVLISLKNEFATFQSLQSYLDNLIKAYNSGGKDKFFEEVRNFISSENLIYGKLFQKLYPEIKRSLKIITLSNSKTLFEIFKLLSQKKKGIEIIISESRPLNEGRILAEKLVSSNIKVQLITEAMIPAYVKICNVAIIGADAVLKNRNVVNKVGSKLLAITANYYKKPFYVVADRTKIKSDNKFLQKEKNSSEIWNYNNKYLTIKNYYFEIIEKKLITKIITD